MDTKILRDGDVVIVELAGRIDYESADPFRANCLKHLINEKVVFDLKNLSFVGSSGITPFVEAITELSECNPNGMKLCGVGSEFRRIFEASDIKHMEIYENSHHARTAFYVSLESQAPVISSSHLPYVNIAEPLQPITSDTVSSDKDGEI